MPLFMKDALEIVPPSRSHCGTISEEKLKLITRRASKTLAPNDKFVLSKLYSNSKSLAPTPVMKLIDVQLKVSKQRNGTLSPTCCRHHWENIQAERRGRIEALLPFHDRFSPPRPMSKALAYANASDKLSKAINLDISKNLRIQAPLSTVIVRWHNSRYYGGYTIRQIFDILRVFGRIESLYVVSEKSARATFTRLDDACSAVNVRFLGNINNPMLCDWFHKTMMNKTFTIKRRHLHVAHDPFIGH